MGCYSSNKSTGRFKSHERKQRHNPSKGGRRLNRPKQSNLGQNHGKGKKPVKKHDENIYHHCGMFGHWLLVYVLLTNLYQAILKDKSKRVETHTIENSTIMTNIEANNASVKINPLALVEARTSLEVFDFLEDPNSQDKALE
ncbi:Uncharacterized protein TCM_028423 [Theobroma cacao]|uniref:Uncharacterized protein n=1 Tax=Theobroma cacao TaxID=3641 RepID=A0A061G9N3_THECC|nr:Uncharacterized protein TCM_028423 [Theobroma cacao]